MPLAGDPAPDSSSLTVASLAAELGLSVRAVSARVTGLCRAFGPEAVVHTAASSNGATLLYADAAAAIRAGRVQAAGVEGDLLRVAEVLAARGVWAGGGSFGADTGYGPVDPSGAAWIAVYGLLPAVFTSSAPGAASAAAELVLRDERVLRLVEFMAANADSDLADQAPIERLADWAAHTPEGEVIGRIARLAQPGAGLAA
ncbi:hypothetical protein ACIGZJ_30855 [Kitasatospora sp. NPDC052868]|uniref:hypothetical protein n=1 Tax=Kitasatospora sp. NPDC052868 TaxID=3364060 RepID=UPI0037CAD866